MGVLQDDEVVLFQVGKECVILGHQPTFAVAHGQVEVVESLGEDARGVGIDCEMAPTVFEAGGLVVIQGDLALVVLAVQGREQSQLHQQLKAVADAQDNAACVEEGLQVVHQGLAGGGFSKAPAQGSRLGSPQVVAIQKAAGKDQKVEIREADTISDEVCKKGYGRFIGACQSGGVGGLHFAVGSVAGYHQGFD